jgi:HEAT repeat protein
LLESSDAALQMYAAAALTWCGEEAAQGIAVLTKGIYLENEALASVAAYALARLGLRQEEATLALVRRLKDAPSSHQYSVRAFPFSKLGPLRTIPRV